MPNDLVQFCVDVYTQIATYAVPCAFVFGMGNMIVNTFLGVAFGGRLRLGGDSNK